MFFTRCKPEEMQRALAKANEEYDGNLVLTDPTPKSGSVRLICRKSGVIGSRLSWQGRKLTAASWEAHRDFLIALFDINPTARVRSKFADYDGKDKFYQRFPGTAYENVGSMMEPCTMPDLTYEPPPKKRLKKGATAPFNAVVRKVRKALFTRMTIGEWDDQEGGPFMDQPACWRALVETAEKIDRIEQRQHLAVDDMFGGEWISKDELAPLFQRRARPMIGKGGKVRWEYEFERQKSSAERFESTVAAARRWWLKEHEEECYEVIE